MGWPGGLILHLRFKLSGGLYSQLPAYTLNLLHSLVGYLDNRYIV